MHITFEQLKKNDELNEYNKTDNYELSEQDFIDYDYDCIQNTNDNEQIENKTEINNQIVEKKDDEINEHYKKESVIKREMLQRVKCLSLHKMNKSILTNTLNMKNNERKELQRIMHTYNDKTFDEIINEFNVTIGENFFNDDCDYSKLPIYKW